MSAKNPPLWLVTAASPVKEPAYAVSFYDSEEHARRGALAAILKFPGVRFYVSRPTWEYQVGGPGHLWEIDRTSTGDV